MCGRASKAVTTMVRWRQDVARITHRDDVAAMVRKGRDLERLVLARAVRWVLQDRVLVHFNKTVVFEE